MKLARLRVYEYRNLEEQQIVLCPQANLFLGRNGQGKTNLLEAIYLLAYGRSFRTAYPRECIRHGRQSCAVEGTVEHSGTEREIQVFITQTEKRLLVHGKSVPLDEFVGNLHVLAFTSGHLGVVRGAPAERRAFLDRAMISLFPGHLRLLASYGRGVKQRNSLLWAARQEGAKPDEALLDTWDATLARDGARILWNRCRYAAELKKSLPAKLFGGEEVKIHYLSTVPDSESGLETIEKGYVARLGKAREKDLAAGFTTVGPHRDDLKIYLDAKPLAEYGSAGQQRSALLSLYFAQMEIHFRTTGCYPVFLMDDVEAELDIGRLQTFLGYLGSRTQICLTTAKESFLPPIPDETRRFHIEDGRIS